MTFSIYMMIYQILRFVQCVCVCLWGGGGVAGCCFSLSYCFFLFCFSQFSQVFPFLLKYKKVYSAFFSVYTTLSVCQCVYVCVCLHVCVSFVYKVLVTLFHLYFLSYLSFHFLFLFVFFLLLQKNLASKPLFVSKSFEAWNYT